MRGRLTGACTGVYLLSSLPLTSLRSTLPPPAAFCPTKAPLFLKTPPPVGTLSPSTLGNTHTGWGPGAPGEETPPCLGLGKTPRPSLRLGPR